MGRHAVVSSPLRSPAVLVGVPVATVLATCCSTAVLGGVVPSAEELPLAAAPSAPAVAGAPAPALPSTDALDAVGDGLDLVSVPTDVRRLATERAEEPVRGSGPRVVRVADEPAGSARPAVTAPREQGVRVVDAGRERGGDATRTVAPRAAGPSASVVPQVTSAGSDLPAASRRTVAAPTSTASTAPTASTASTASATGETVDDAAPAGSALDLDTPAGGLSVLSFG